MADTKKYNLFELAYKEASLETIENKKSKLSQEIKEYEEIALSDNNSTQSFISLELAELRDQELHIAKAMDTIKKTCNHGLMLYLGKRYQNEVDMGLAICLECEQHFYLNGCDKDIEIDPECIINVADILPTKYICTYVGSKNILVTKAREKLISLAKVCTEMSLEEIKQTILEYLVCYCDELSENTVISRRRKKKISGGKN